MIETKLNGQTVDVVAENVKKLKELFPEIVIEDKIDFDRLQDVLGNYIERNDECYRFNWYGKSDAFRKSQAQSTGTLRPCVEESKNWDATENLYIEGDNLEVLKILEKSYSGKIKMIYIDPPYNKDKDFVYSDKWSDPIKEYKKITGQVNDDGTMSDTEEETEGGRHTKWLNMMYPRLRKARNLLTDDGVIFISIGQAEIDNVIKLCNELYGEDNKISIISRVMKSGSAQGQFFSPNIEYIAVYAKDISKLEAFREPMTEEIIKKLYTSIETEGERKGEKYRPFGLYQSSLDPLRGCSNQRYFIEAPDGTLLLPPGNVFPINKNDGATIVPQTSDDKVWRWSKDRYLEEKSKGNITFKKSSGVLVDSEGKPAEWNVYTKIWLNDRQEDGMVPVDLITKWENRQSKKELQDINIPFDFAKPVNLINYLISIVGDTSTSIILDFFSGSATTAHAVMQLNAEDGGNRKFICVQLPESCDESSEAFKAGYKNICEIGKERIRRAGEKIKAELQEKYDAFKQKQQSLLDDEAEPMNPEDLDIGFKVFKLDSSNLRRWNLDVGENFHKLSEKEQNAFISEKLGLLVNNFTEGRTELDMVYEIMLKYGLPLTMPVEIEKVFSKKLNKDVTLYNIGMGGLIVCLSDKLCEDIADGIVKLVEKTEPATVRVAVKDINFMTDDSKTNFKETLRTGVESYFAKTDNKANNENQFEFITI